MSEANQIQHFNGINAVTGDYGLTLSAQMLVEQIIGTAEKDKLRNRQAEFAAAAQETKQAVVRGVRAGVDGTNLAEAGWGIIFAYNDPRVDAIKAALQPLLTMRGQQAGPYFRIFTGVDAYRQDETKRQFLDRFGIRAGAVDPKQGVPYYLLLIGSPALIPFEFQYQLDVQFAVGRLDFATVEEYANYAKAVVAAETGQQQLARTATFFSVTNADDSATATTDQFLIKPLVDALTPGNADWAITTYTGRAANRTHLESLLGGAQKPAVLFTASHGIEFPAGNARQESHQGALLCDEWPGPKAWRGELPESFYFAGDHLARSADPSGMIAFHFACYGGGTPQYNDFEQPSPSTSETTARKAIAQRPFVARLPQKLLGHPNGGALAVVSHVDRAWSYADRQRSTTQTAVFEDTLLRLLQGQPLGWALEFFNNRYAELAATLSEELNRLRWRNSPLAYFELATMWAENHDARNYIVLGDPAVRVAVAQKGGAGSKQRPAAIPVAVDGRPQMISVTDWQQTPTAVKQLLTTALRQVDQLNTQLDQAAKATPVVPPPVYRDGGRSSGGQLRSATTRGGTTRGGVTRSGGLRSGQPPQDDGEDKR